MVAIGGDPLTTMMKIPGANIGVTIGSDSYGLVEESNTESHYAENTDPVGGSNAQVITAGARLTEVTFTMLASTDMPTNWSTLQYGDLPTKTVVFTLLNTQNQGRTITIPYCKIFRHGYRHQKDQLLRRTVRILSPAAMIEA